MKHTPSIRSLAAMGLLATAALAHAATGPFPWPHGAKAAVSLAYDDAIDSQLDNAIPALDRVGLKGSFYLKLASPAVARRMATNSATTRCSTSARRPCPTANG